MANYEIVTASNNHSKYIYDNLRDIDRIEVNMLYKDRQEFLRDLKTADWTNAVLVDGKPVMLFGVAPSDTENVGVPFLLRTRALDLVKREFIRQSVDWIETMHMSYKLLVNQVHKDNKSAIKWLKFCGFKFSKEPMIVNGVPVLTFWRSRNV